MRLMMWSRYLSAAELSSQNGDIDSAKEYAARGLAMDEICSGLDSPLYQESFDRARKIDGGAARG